MSEDSNEQGKQGGGFTVKDRRRIDDHGNLREVPEEQEATGAPATGAKDGGEEGCPPEQRTGQDKVDFASFIGSLATSALYHMGLAEDDDNKKSPVNMPLARSTIDIIDMLREKTEGNLSEEEQTFLRNILYQLRMQYVEICRSQNK